MYIIIALLAHGRLGLYQFFYSKCFLICCFFNCDIHFNKHAGGSPTISEEDFARILLRHTTWDLDPVFERLKKGKDVDKVNSCLNLYVQQQM